MDVLFNFFKWEPGCGIISSENTWHWCFPCAKPPDNLKQRAFTKVFQLVDIYYF